MASSRSASNPDRPRQADATLDPKKKRGQKDKVQPVDAARPRTGGTGRLGKRAERPSEGSDRKANRSSRPGRTGRAPSG
jgi:hypothetical protein